MKKTAVILIIAFFSMFACGGKEVKKVSDESKTAIEAFETAEKIKEAYLSRDLSALEGYTTKDGYRDMLGAMKKFDKAELNFSHKWVDIDKSTVSLRISWDGKWVTGGQTKEEKGIAIFVFEGKPLKLSTIQRANPFRQPE